MKFHKGIALAIMFGAFVGTVLAEITISPPLGHHLIHGIIMTIFAILMGLLGGWIR